MNTSKSVYGQCMYPRSPFAQQNKVRRTSLASLASSLYAYLVLRLCSQFLEQRITL